MEYWYEVFIDEGEEIGTHTIEAFNTLEEAVVVYNKLKNLYPENKYGIDKWIGSDEGGEPVEDCTPKEE